MGITSALYQTIKYKIVRTGSDVNSPEASISIKPYKDNGFKLDIQNHTDDKIVIDWNKAFYLNDGASDGHLDKRGQDYILPKKQGGWILHPIALQEYRKSHNDFSYVGKKHAIAKPITYDLVQKPFSNGKHGIDLTLKIGEKEVSATPYLNIEKVKRF